MDHNSTVYLVDDRRSEADEYKDLLDSASGSFEIRVLEPTEQKEDIGTLLGDEQTGGFIIDQRLDDLVSYDGTELAAYLRLLRDDIPLFMLTSFPRDVKGHKSEDTIDNVFDKNDVRSAASTVVRRIERRIGQYRHALSHKLVRLRDLLDRQAASNISDDEATELAELRMDFERPADYSLMARNDQLERSLEHESNLISRLERLVIDLSHKEVE